MKGQTWIEFIVATSIFLISIGFIFITASGNLKEEIQKSQQQTACLKAYELENFLRNPGNATDWDTSGNLSVFGLSQSGNKSLIISSNKWQAMKNTGFANISKFATPSQSWNIGYNTYAFGFNISNPDTNCIISNSISICRNWNGLIGAYISITANSTSKARTSLKLFLPFTSAHISDQTNESDDLISITNANGTYVTLIFNTNSTDQDYVKISPISKLIFIEQFNVESGQYLPFILGNNTLLQDNFGATPPPNAMLCDTKVSGLLNLTNESLLADFNLEAW